MNASPAAAQLTGFATGVVTRLDDALRDVVPILRREVEASSERWSALRDLAKDAAPQLVASARDRGPFANAARSAASELALGQLILGGIDDALRSGAAVDDAMLAQVADAVERFRYARIDLSDIGNLDGGSVAHHGFRVMDEERIVDATVSSAALRRERAAALGDIKAAPLPEPPRFAPSHVRLEHSMAPLAARQASIRLYERAVGHGLVDGTGRPTVDLYDAIRIAERLDVLGMPFTQGLEEGTRVLLSGADTKAMLKTIEQLSTKGISADEALHRARSTVHIRPRTG